ncbi:MAG TPA: tetratricopeptide repeat protein [Thermoanaerobaculia bacterium]|nr:tetratricopeptide repeat protein [Thermoanaerobaculia bacterium]
MRASRAAVALSSILVLGGCRSTLDAAKKLPEPSPAVADLVDYRQGLTLLREGRVDEAIRAAYPRSAEVANALGLAYLYRKDHRNATKLFAEALALDENLVEARNNLGVAAMEAGRFEDAEKDFSSVLAGARTSEHVKARFNLGLLRARQLRWADAERELTTVLADDPGYLNAARERGLARMKLEDFRGALEDFLLFLREDGNDPVANYNAALCLLTTDRRDPAVPYMERTVPAAPERDEARKARRFLGGEPGAAGRER